MKHAKDTNFLGTPRTPFYEERHFIKNQARKHAKFIEQAIK